MPRGLWNHGPRLKVEGDYLYKTIAMYVCSTCGTRHISKTLAACKGLEFTQNYNQQPHIFTKCTDIKSSVTHMHQLHHNTGQKSKQS